MLAGGGKSCCQELGEGGQELGEGGQESWRSGMAGGVPGPDGHAADGHATGQSDAGGRVVIRRI